MRISDWSSDVCSSDLWVVASGFRAQPGGFCLLPGADGSLEEVLLAIDPEEPLWSFAGLPAVLPPGVYRIAQGLRPRAASRAARSEERCVGKECAGQCISRCSL